MNLPGKKQGHIASVSSVQSDVSYFILVIVEVLPDAASGSFAQIKDSKLPFVLIREIILLDIEFECERLVFKIDRHKIMYVIFYQ